MFHNSVLQIDGPVPFAAAFHQVLGAIVDLDEAVAIDGCDIAGTEPAVRERGRIIGDLPIAIDDPEPSDLQLAHSFTVPGQLASEIIHNAHVNARYGQSVTGEELESLVVGK